jgi:hypothetical protein
MASSDGHYDEIRNITEKCEKLVDDTVGGRLNLEEFGNALRQTGISIEAAGDYVQEVKQRLEGLLSIPQGNSSTGASGPSNTQHGTIPEELEPTTGNTRDRTTGSATATASSDNPSSTEANDEIGWALLRSKLINTRRSDPQTGESHSNVSLADVLKVLSHPSSSDSESSIPSSVLAIAPHLANLSKAVALDDHLGKTWELRQAFCSDKAVEPIIDLLQSQYLQEPIPRSIWRKIVRDEFVDFERLYGSTDRDYSHKDDYKEFAGGFVLAKKEQLYSRKVIRNEADWARMFSAWEAGVLLLYPHRVVELQNYHRLVIDLFRATPHNTTIAIHFDAEARDRYSRSPYHLDDREMLHAPLLVQLFSSSSSSNKRDSDSSPSPPKRATVPCQNWSLGLCDDPCSNRRKHGVCSECGEPHRAKEVDRCFTSLRDKRRGTNPGFATSDGSSGKA